MTDMTAMLREAAEQLTYWQGEAERMAAENDRLLKLGNAMAEALVDCSDDLEAELKDRWLAHGMGALPSMQARFERDMQPVNKARAALSAWNGEHIL